MPYYSFEKDLQPQPAPPADWQGTLAVLTPQELRAAALPAGLTAPVAPADPHESQFCWLRVDSGSMTGHLRIPARANQPARRFSFVWRSDVLLVADHDGVVSGSIGGAVAPLLHAQTGADDFLVDLLISLIRDDLPYIQQLETRLTNLEQAVLDENTTRFLHQMSVIRKELNRTNRFYAQLGDFASLLLEDGEERFGGRAKKRLGHFLRRLENLRGETRMLHEYATQISSEYQAQVDILQNRVMKLLTIVTAIFLPLSLIAGWYGMNFIDMPLLRWQYGYPLVVIVSVLVVALLVWYFKRKKWF